MGDAFDPTTDVGVPLSQLAKLREPWPIETVRWMVRLKKGSDSSEAPAFAYVDARDVMNRLDDVLGPQNWRDRYHEVGDAVVCSLEIRVIVPVVDTVTGEVSEAREWLAKEDGSGRSSIEGEKGAISGALKRAFAKWGGRDLYDVDLVWVRVERRGTGQVVPAADQYAKLRAALLKARGATDTEAAEQTVSQQWTSALRWAVSVGVDEAMLREYVGIGHDEDPGSSHVDAVREQAKLVVRGEMTGPQAFGPNAQARARAVDEQVEPTPFDSNVCAIAGCVLEDGHELPHAGQSGVTFLTAQEERERGEAAE